MIADMNSYTNTSKRHCDCKEDKRLVHRLINEHSHTHIRNNQFPAHSSRKLLINACGNGLVIEMEGSIILVLSAFER